MRGLGTQPNQRFSGPWYIVSIRSDGRVRDLESHLTRPHAERVLEILERHEATREKQPNEPSWTYRIEHRP